MWLNPHQQSPRAHRSRIGQLRRRLWLATWGTGAALLIGAGATGGLLPLAVISWMTFAISLGYTISQWSSAMMIGLVSVSSGLSAHGAATVPGSAGGGPEGVEDGNPCQPVGLAVD